MPLGNPNPAGSFHAASGIDPADLGQAIGILAVTACLLWGAVYLRRVFYHGWRKGEMGHILVGLFLALVLFFLVSWTVTNF